MTRTFTAALLAIAAAWPGLAASGPDIGFDQNLLVGFSFGGPERPELSLSLRIEQPAEIGRAIANVLGTAPPSASGTPAVVGPNALLPPLAQWDWRSHAGWRARVNGLSVFMTPDAASAAEAKQRGFSSTTKYLLGGAALAAVAVAVAGGSSSKKSDGGSGDPGCNCPTCDGQVSAICSNNRLDDDGDCSTTCDTL